MKTPDTRSEPCPQGYAIFLFDSTQGALKAERALLRAGFSIKLIPTPREISSDCGTALRCDWSDSEAVQAALHLANASFASVHHIEERA
jgi:hypothetical protein